MKFLTWLEKRIKSSWRTSLAGILIFIGYHLAYKGHISFDDFKDYIALIPTILLLLSKDSASSDKQQ